MENPEWQVDDQRFFVRQGVSFLEMSPAQREPGFARSESLSALVPESPGYHAPE